MLITTWPVIRPKAFRWMRSTLKGLLAKSSRASSPGETQWSRLRWWWCPACGKDVTGIVMTGCLRHLLFMCWWARQGEILPASSPCCLQNSSGQTQSTLACCQMTSLPLLMPPFCRSHEPYDLGIPTHEISWVCIRMITGDDPSLLNQVFRK